MKEILKFIPGFRTSTKWKMIIAGIYYLISLMMLTAGIDAFLFFQSIPFVVFYAVKAVKVRKKQPVIVTMIAFIVMCFSLGLAPKTTETIVSTNKVNSVKKVSIESKTKLKPISNKKTSIAVKASNSQSSIKSTSPVSGQFRIHYINVGQGDSELIQCNGQTMLIDTGTNESVNSLISYLQSQKINKIDYLVLTHPHEDHIGGAAAVINTFDIGNIYMNQKSTTTETYKDVINAIAAKGIKPVQPTLGTTFKLGSANCIVYGPVNPTSDDLNTYSIVIKVTFGNNKFLFTGDAQASNETGMIGSGYDLSADVLKVGHHGSHTSTSEVFLDKVNPKYAIVSCGKGNDYGHPHTETMKRLQAKEIQVYRTDEEGTIVCTSDGNNISFNCSPGDYASGTSSSGSSNNAGSNSRATSSAQSIQQPQNQSVSQSTPVATQNQSQNTDCQYEGDSKTHKFHILSCRWAQKISSENAVYFHTRDEAILQGYVPCKVCKP